jgi:CSLREA domain-containing protein
MYIVDETNQYSGPAQIRLKKLIFKRAYGQISPLSIKLNKYHPAMLKWRRVANIGSNFPEEPTVRHLYRLGWAQTGRAILFAIPLMPSAPVGAATFTVTKTADTADGACDADCSLREAVIAANANPGADIIIVPAGTYTLTINGAGEEAAATGDLDITGDLVIRGSGANDTIIQAGAASGALGDRIFDISPLGSGIATVTISGVTLRHGAPPNVSPYSGGGAILNNGNLTISDCVISNNAATGQAGGGIRQYNPSATLSIARCTFTSNSSDKGGAVEATQSGPAYQLRIEQSNFQNNNGGGSGGAISTSQSFISRSTFLGNTAQKGGALEIYGGYHTIQESTFTNNTATTWGGGIAANNAYRVGISNSTISSNTAPKGGGLYNEFGYQSVITNSTISGNTASTSGGGVHNDRVGNMLLRNVTLTGNTSPSGANGGNLYNYTIISANKGSVHLGNSIVASPSQGDNCTGSDGITSDGYNIDSGTTCALAAVGDLNNANPLLGSLVNNGGPTYTHALLSGSPAIDAGNPGGCTWDHDNDSGTAEVPLTRDQRGAPRVTDGDGTNGARCDIGAYERWVLAYHPASFADVPSGHYAYAYVETVAASGITSGCGGGHYCPDSTVTRAQMAVFLERGMKGASYTPPPATGTLFNDVGAGDFAAAWIEQLSLDGITSGCGWGSYCPNTAVSRAQMAVFLLRAKHGSSYVPPASACTTFADAPSGSFACEWIEQMMVESITSGCGGGNYCPNTPVTRAQMAVFLQRAFNLALAE